MDTAIDFSDLSNMENGWEFLMFLQKNDITFEIVKWNGPGGGWPQIFYTGTKEALELMLKERFECDEQDVEWHISEAIEVQE